MKKSNTAKTYNQMANEWRTMDKEQKPTLNGFSVSNYYLYLVCIITGFLVMKIVAKHSVNVAGRTCAMCSCVSNLNAETQRNVSWKGSKKWKQSSDIFLKIEVLLVFKFKYAQGTNQRHSYTDIQRKLFTFRPNEKPVIAVEIFNCRRIIIQPPKKYHSKWMWAFSFIFVCCIRLPLKTVGYFEFDWYGRVFALFLSEII